MDFKTTLNELVSSVDGAIGAGLVGLDGLVIDQSSSKSEFDINVAGAEYATIVKNARKASEGFGAGKTSEILISTEKATIVLMMVGSEYFCALAIGLDGNIGRGRLELKKIIPKIEKEF